MTKTALEAVEAAAEDQDESSPSEEVEETASTQADVSNDTATGDEDSELLTEGESEPGPIPYSRFKGVVTERNQVRQEAERVRQEAEQVRQQLQALEWAQQLNPQEVQRAVEINQFMQQDPLAFKQYLIREIEANPHLRAQMESQATPELPEPDLRAENGQYAYSADATKALAAALARQEVTRYQAEIGAQFQQLQQVVHGLQQSANDAQLQSSAKTYTDGLMQELGALPGFKEHEGKISEAFAQIDPNIVMRDGVKAAVLSAYLSVVTPTAEKKAQEKAKETMRKKAAAGTVDPSGSKQESSKRPRTERDLEATLERLSKGA